jgi:hypothetical protein
MLRDMIGVKAGKVTSRRDVQAIRILLTQAAARVVEMIENTKTYCRLTITLHEPLRRRCKNYGVTVTVHSICATSGWTLRK